MGDRKKRQAGHVHTLEAWMSIECHVEYQVAAFVEDETNARAARIEFRFVGFSPALSCRSPIPAYGSMAERWDSKPAGR
jgi:hypothetical protein